MTRRYETAAYAPANLRLQEEVQRASRSARILAQQLLAASGEMEFPDDVAELYKVADQIAASFEFHTYPSLYRVKELSALLGSQLRAAGSQTPRSSSFGRFLRDAIRNHGHLDISLRLAVAIQDKDRRASAELGKVTRPAEWITTLASRALPARGRIRYSEEFRSELAEITRSGGSRRTQLAYAGRQLIRVPRLRAQLRVAPRRSAAQ